MRKFLPLIVVAVALWMLYVMNAPRFNSVATQPASHAVTLQSSAVSNVVQMFDTLAVDAAVIEQYPDGTRCTRLRGPTDASVDGISMSFYRLNCNGTRGYVNTKWVRLD